jgi:hypothetical protein
MLFDGFEPELENCPPNKMAAFLGTSLALGSVESQDHCQGALYCRLASCEACFTPV